MKMPSAAPRQKKKRITTFRRIKIKQILLLNNIIFFIKKCKIVNYTFRKKKLNKIPNFKIPTQYIFCVRKKKISPLQNFEPFNDRYLEFQSFKCRYLKIWSFCFILKKRVKNKIKNPGFFRTRQPNYDLILFVSAASQIEF